MKKVKVSLLVKGNIVCSQYFSAHELTYVETIGCRPDAEIPDKFVRRIYYGPEPEDCDEIEFDLTNATVICGDMRVESMFVKEGQNVLVTGNIVAMAPKDYTPERFVQDFPYKSK